MGRPYQQLTHLRPCPTLLSSGNCNKQPRPPSSNFLRLAKKLSSRLHTAASDRLHSLRRNMNQLRRGGCQRERERVAHGTGPFFLRLQSACSSISLGLSTICWWDPLSFRFQTSTASLSLVLHGLSGGFPFLHLPPPFSLVPSFRDENKKVMKYWTRNIHQLSNFPPHSVHELTTNSPGPRIVPCCPPAVQPFLSLSCLSIPDCSLRLSLSRVKRKLGVPFFFSNFFHVIKFNKYNFFQRLGSSSERVMVLLFLWLTCSEILQLSYCNYNSKQLVSFRLLWRETRSTDDVTPITIPASVKPSSSQSYQPLCLSLFLLLSFLISYFFFLSLSLSLSLLHRM